MDNAVNSGAADAVGLGDLAEAVSALTIDKDGFAVQHQRFSSDLPAFEAGAPHAGAHRSTIRLRSSSAMAPMMVTTARPRGPPVSICSRKLTNSIPRWFSSSSTSKKCFTDRRDPVRSPDQDHIEAAAAGVAHQFIETRPACLHAGDPVCVLLDDLIAALRGHLAQVIDLGLRMLIEARDPDIKGGAFHLRRPLGEFFSM